MQKQVHGGDIYSTEYRLDFSANINPLGTPEKVLDAACRGVRCSEHYPDVFCRKLRKAIADRERIDRDHVICGNGAAELIFLLVQTLRPKRALLVTPGFAEYEFALRSVGCEINYYACLPEFGFEIQQDFTDDIADRYDIAFLCNPANPTGVLIPQDILEKTVEICQEKGTLLVVDECFNAFLEDGDQRSVVRMTADHDQLFVLKAFTKIYAMAGLRLGYGISCNMELLERMHNSCQPWNVSIPAQMAGTAAMQETEFEQESRDYVTKQRILMKKELEKMGLHCSNAAANYLFFRGPERLTEKCAEQGILIRDCSNYEGLSEGYYRVAVKKEEENRILLQVLRQILE